jgi:nicotinamide riboside kinase
VTLVVNLLGRPSVGKSGLAGAIVGKLKARHFRAEQVTEYAKSLILDGNIAALRNQAFVLGNQYHWVERCIDKTDIVVTDSPTLLSSIYAPSEYPQSFHDFVLWTHRAHDCVNFFLRRDDNSVYMDELRVDDERSSRQREMQIEQLLVRNEIPFIELQVNETAADQAVRHIIAAIRERGGYLTELYGEAD